MIPTNTNNTTTFKIFVGCIPGKTKDSEIRAVFKQYKSLIGVNLERRKNKKCSGYGYIELTDRKEYDTVLETKHYLGDRMLTTMPYLEKRDLINSQLNFNKRRIVIAGLPNETEDRDLRQYFLKFGSIEKAFVVKNNSDPNLKPYGHVIFNSESSATRAKKKVHYIRGKRVQIKTHKINLKKKLKNLKLKKESPRFEIDVPQRQDMLEIPKKSSNIRLERKLSGNSISKLTRSFITMNKTQILNDILRHSKEIHESNRHDGDNVRFNKQVSPRRRYSGYLDVDVLEIEDVPQFIQKQGRMRRGMEFNLF